MFRDIGVVLVVIAMVLDEWTMDMEGGGSTRSGLRLKVVKMVFTFIFLDEEKIQVSDSVTAVHLTMFVV